MKEGRGSGMNGAGLKDRIGDRGFESGAVNSNPGMVPLEARPTPG